jgi:hypothetical protein
MAVTLGQGLGQSDSTYPVIAQKKIDRNFKHVSAHVRVPVMNAGYHSVPLLYSA